MTGTITIEYDRNDPQIHAKLKRVGKDLPYLIDRMEGIGRIEVRNDNKVVYYPQEGLAVRIQPTVVVVEDWTEEDIAHLGENDPIEEEVA